MVDVALERITILLQAKDRDFARAMDRNNKLIAKLNREGSRNMGQLQRRVDSHLSGMASSAASFGTSFAKGLAVGAITGVLAGITASVRGAVTSLSALGKAARDAGIDVEQLQGLQRGFSRSARMSDDDLTRALIDFNVRIGQAAEGQGEFARISERLGIALRRPNGEMRTQSELLAEVADRIRDAGSASERAAIAQGAFGEVGRRMADTMSGGSDALRQMTDQARSAGDIIDRNLIHRAEILDDKFDALTRRVGTFFRALAVGAMAGGAETATDTLVSMFGTIERAQAVLGEPLFEALIAEAGELAELDGVTDQLERIARNSEQLQGAALRTAAAMSDVTMQLSDLGLEAEMLSFDEIVNGMEQLVAELRRGEISAEDFEGKLEDVAAEAVAALTELQRIDGLSLAGAISQIIAMVRALDAARAEARGLRSDLPGAETTSEPGVLARLAAFEPLGPGGRVTPTVTVDANGTTRPRAAPPMLGEPPPPGPASRGGAGASDGYLQAVADIEARTRALEMEAAALIAVAASGLEYADAVEFARVKAQLLNQALAEGRQITPELEAQVDALAAAYVTAGQAAEDAARRMEDVRANSERGIETMVDLFMAIGQGGDAARQAVARLLIELARVQAMRAFSGMAGSSGGGFFSALGGLLSGSRAGGGEVRAGHAYRVNENTANSEIFVPSRSGGILNVAQARDALRGGGGMSVSIGFDPSMDAFRAAVRDETGQVVAQGIQEAMPGIVGQSVVATHRSFGRMRPK